MQTLPRHTLVHLLAVLCFAGVSIPSSALAADQTEYLKKTPSVLPEPGTYFDADGELSYDKARKLVEMAFREEFTSDGDFYCIINVVRWADDKPAADKTHWYTYRSRGSMTGYAGRWTPARFKEARIFGSDRIAVLYVHLNVPAISREDAKTAIAEKIAAKTIIGATLADLLPDKGDPSPKLRSDRNQTLRSVGNYLVSADYTKVTYRLDVVKKLPAPIQSLQDALGLLQSAGAPEPSIKLQPMALYAGDVFDIEHVPSDITVTGTLAASALTEDKPIDLGKQTYDNEGLYYWDVSLGIPVKSVNQLQFETSGGDIFAREVDEAQLMLLLNIFWRPVDTKKTKLLLAPSPIVGIALDKRPLDKVLVGLSMGLNRVQFYGGVQWTKKDTVPVSAGGAVQEAEYDDDIVFGINVPVRQVVAFLKAKK